MRTRQRLHRSLLDIVRASRSVAFAIVVAGTVTLSLSAQESSQLTPAEHFVLGELEKGKVADLSRRPIKDRVLRSAFIEKLLTGGYTDPEIMRRGVSISNAVFKDTILVSSEAVPFRVWLQSCEFDHGVDFSYTTFARDLSLNGSHFGTATLLSQGGNDNDDIQAYFAGMKVDGTTTFSDTVFYAPVDFTYAQLGADFVFNDVNYQPNHIADFDSLTVRGPAFFKKDSFAGPLSLSDAELFKLVIEDPTSQAIELDLGEAHIKRGGEIKNVRLSSWRASFLVADGPVILDGVTPSGAINLAHSHFRGLIITDFDEWLKLKPGALNLDGFSFDNLTIAGANMDPPAARMLELINSESCPFSPQPYLELERFLRAHGDVQKADEVYIGMRRRQRQKLSWINRPWDFLLDKMLGYGKETWRAVLCAMFMVVVGAIVFVPDRMEWKNPQAVQNPYNRFLYSLDQLAPVIDLDAAKSWGAKPDQPWTRNYAVLHRIAGWILLPLVVGAITGIVK